MGEDINFYRANEKPYGGFSNLYRRPVEIESEVFPTVEHAYQSRKARKPAVRRWILAAPTPSLVASAAHGLLHWDIAPGWSRLRYPWMLKCLQAKFGQHGDLAALLMNTGTARLVESGTVDSEVNRRWGEINGVGRNLLGRMLMRVRADLGGPSYQDDELANLVAAGIPLLTAA
ncbi:MAG: NADAR family protein [Desulfovibrio sp.]|uniref:NADAR family protein n=1 Tax=Desulfovibrio sp. TaxID=885 RepID=UPI00135D9085|nr:NADAR family protein [Desulfovibrio sp.]MTJ93605.1 NADAR family protein [Desulfovibrio sp.]